MCVCVLDWDESVLGGKCVRTAGQTGVFYLCVCQQSAVCSVHEHKRLLRGGDREFQRSRKLLL